MGLLAACKYVGVDPIVAELLDTVNYEFTNFSIFYISNTEVSIRDNFKNEFHISIETIKEKAKKHNISIVDSLEEIATSHVRKYAQNHK